MSVLRLSALFLLFLISCKNEPSTILPKVKNEGFRIGTNNDSLSSQANAAQSIMKYYVRINGNRYNRGDFFKIVPGEIVYFQLIGEIDGHANSYPVTTWQVPTCLTFLRQFEPDFNNANQYSCGRCNIKLFPSQLIIYKLGTSYDAQGEGEPVNINLWSDLTWGTSM